MNRHVIMEGDCGLCGAPVTAINGVWPPGHGLGECVPQQQPAPDIVRGETIRVPIAALFEQTSDEGDKM
jgi:hypothetical protein